MISTNKIPATKQDINDISIFTNVNLHIHIIFIDERSNHVPKKKRKKSKCLPVIRFPPPPPRSPLHLAPLPTPPPPPRLLFPVCVCPVHREREREREREMCLHRWTYVCMYVGTQAGRERAGTRRCLSQDDRRPGKGGQAVSSHPRHARASRT